MEEEERANDPSVIKRRLNHELEPIKVMLVHKREELSIEDWLQFVEVTRKSILQHPDQYLDKDFPSREMLEILINKIIDDFLISSKRTGSSVSNSGLS